MATLVDERPEEEVQTEELSFEEPVQETPPEEDIPEKYRGKDLKDIVRMHQEAEKLIGKQSREVGELRQTFDQYIQTQLTPKAPPPDEEDFDFFTDPEKAVARAIASNPAVKNVEAAAVEMRKRTALATLEAKHPDMKTVVQDPGFGEWIQASPVRTRLFRQADSQYDYESADELLSLWKERQGIVQQTAKVEEQARKQTVKQASMGSSRSSGEAPSRKVYRRADIIKLMKTDPDRYEALAPEILEAYRTNRVK
jgi:hypothetical protein